LTGARSDSSAPPARVVLVGVRGYGAVHAERIARLAERGAVQLVAAVDPGVVIEPPTIYGVNLYADLTEALAAVGPVDVVIVAAPIGDHFRLAHIALTSGADVYLEKPPVASLEDFTALLATEQETERVVQVGFQSLGSRALEMLAVDAVGIGPVVRVSAVGAWSRTVGYWNRSPWAGRRSLHGRPVVDGVATNPLAHAVATALAVVGCRRLDEVESVDTDLYRANAIDSDDTSVVRIRTTRGLEVTCALTLCSAVEREPEVHIEGSRGRATFAYTADRVETEVAGQTRTQITTRVDLLENLLAHRRDGTPLLVPLASTGAFMRVLGAVAKHSERDRILVPARIGGIEVALYRDGRGTIPTSSPRPVLHPVRTLAGVVVTANHPADHDWHSGVGMAIPDVNGTNFWGGSTYIYGQGYVLLDDHGVIVGEPPVLQDDAFTQELRWIGRDGSVQIREQRFVAWAAMNKETWRLDFESSLRADAGVTLGSPGSKGRIDGGYGGFFWRFPACENIEVFTAQGRGEVAVQGSVAPWLAWSADFAAGPGMSGPATIVIAAPDAAAAGEPWFVRARDYPGFGSALAWDRPAELHQGAVLQRRFTVATADGRLTEEQTTALATQLMVRNDAALRVE